ncbi:MAG TPA: hypothetical protein VJO33_01415 [Gemmatimonadaceae bacterium]|nr:hypothetical protein [Gemmatimonadaceae bacterium]
MRLLLLVLVPAALHAQYSRERVSLVLQGEEALQRQEIRSAIDAFREAARDTSARRRSAAERMLGVIDWRFYKDAGSARLHFGAALATKSDTPATLIEMARLATVEGRYREAFALADRARVSAGDDVARRGAILQMGDAVSGSALATRLGDDVGSPAERVDTTAAAAAVEALSQLLRETPGRAEEAKRLLLAALDAGDGSAAARAVQSYFLIDVGEGTMHTSLPRTVAELERELPLWRGDSTSRAVRTQLATLLVEARLMDAAVLVTPPGTHTDIVAYVQYCRRIARRAEDYYRRSLVGEAQHDELTRSYIHATRDLWPRLTWNGAPPQFFPTAGDVELSRRFGTLLELGVTGGYYDMHMGHVIADGERTVTQYGHSARVMFIMLDGMVTNGLQSWAWDDAGGHGGWQRRDTIVQVRPIFVEHAVSLWVSADTTRRAHERENIAIDSTVDWRLAAADSIAYLPGVAARLRRDGRDALLDSLRRAGVPDSLLGATFVRVTSRLIRGSSIVAHEGRHAIDDQLRTATKLSTEEREFRAKLSEIAFAARPKIVMSSIMHPNIGDATPHGRANARVMLGLIRWMRAHRSMIPGFDVARPILPQLPLLTDAQLRLAFRSMDPLAPRD